MFFKTILPRFLFSAGYKGPTTQFSCHFSIILHKNNLLAGYKHTIEHLYTPRAKINLIYFYPEYLLSQNKVAFSKNEISALPQLISIPL